MAYGGESVIPPQYDEVVAQHSCPVGGLLTYVDFLPQCLEEKPIVLRLLKFETFDTLIERANQYLSRYPTWEAKTCESIELKSKWMGKTKPEKMTYIERGKDSNCFLRGLRLWLVPRLTQYPQQLGYVNIVPEIVKENGNRWPEFESLDEVLQKFNENIRKDPNIIPGKIITIETQEMKVTNVHSLQPDDSFWREYADFARRFVVVIRVFYEKYIDTMDTKEREEIGIADFKPTLLEEPIHSKKKAKYEPFSNVIQAASSWCAQQRNIRYCNAQTFEVKIKSDNTTDTQRMAYTEHAEDVTYYIRILRLAYVTLTGDRVAPLLHLTCKNFQPMMTVKVSYSVDKYETLSQTRARIEEWLRVTGGKVLSCETAAMRLSTGGERKCGLDTSFTYNKWNIDEHWIYIIRVFLDGYYPEPPVEVLSPPPEVQVLERNCTLM